ncbi:MAG: TonB-dependent receptor plug domain-containing protein [Prochlorotrichaceae cyanobacterium]
MRTVFVLGTIVSNLLVSAPLFANPEVNNLELNTLEDSGENSIKIAQEEPEIRVTITEKLLQQPIFTPFRREGTVQESTRATFVITKEEIEAQGWQTVDEALRYLPGAFTDGTGGGQLGAQSGQFIRGSNSNQVLILLDGRPLNDLGFSGNFDLSELTADIVEQIEVLPGGGSTLYGSGAIGGVINIITRVPVKEGIEVRPSLQLGSLGLNQQGLQFSGRQGSLAWIVGYDRLQAQNNFSYQINNDQFKFTDPAASSTPFNLEDDRNNADVLYNNFNIKLITDLSDRHRLTWSGLYLDKNLGVPSGVPIPVTGSAGEFNSLTPNFRQDTQEWLMDVTLDSKLGQGDNSTLTAKLYLDSLQYTSSNPDGYTIADDVNRFSIGFQAQHNWQISDRQMLTYGADYRQVQASNNTVLFDGSAIENYDSELNQGALFARYQMDFTPNLRAHVGLRQDFNSLANGAFTSPSFGVSWDVTPLTTFRANYARSFRAPLISDLEGFAAFGAIGNPNLEPERSHSFDMGFDQQLGDRGLLRFSYFLNDVDHLIDYPAPDFSPVNLGRVQTTGIETALNLQLAKNIFFLANYTWNNPEIKESPDGLNEGNEPSFRGADVLNIGVSYENPRGLFAGAFVRNVGDRFTSNANTEALKSYTTIDFKVRVPLSDRWNLNASLNNILDESIQEYPGYPGIGRNFQVGVQGRI